MIRRDVSTAARRPRVRSGHPTVGAHMDARVRQVKGGSGPAARTGAAPGPRGLHPVLVLQRAVGNRAVVSSMPVQRKTAGTAKAQALKRLKTEFGITAVRE